MKKTKKTIINRSSRRKRGMASNPLFIISDFFFVWTLLWLRFAKLRQPTGQTFFPTSQRNFPISFKPKVAIAKFVWKMQKKVWYYEKWVGRHASFPPRQSVKYIKKITLKFFCLKVLKSTYKHIELLRCLEMWKYILDSIGIGYLPCLLGSRRKIAKLVLVAHRSIWNNLKMLAF